MVRRFRWLRRSRNCSVTIATLQGNTAVEAYGGVEAWSDYDAGEGLWHVLVRRDGQISTTSVPLGQQDNRSRGQSGSIRPAGPRLSQLRQQVSPGGLGLEWQRPPSRPRHTRRLASDRLGRAGRVGERHREGDDQPMERAPTEGCWRGAATQVLGNGNYSVEACVRSSRSVEALALHGRQLALIDTFILNDGIGSGITTEVRIEKVTGGPQRLVALLDVGEGDESWLGPSWFGGELYFYEDTVDAPGAVDGFDPARDTSVSTPSYAYLTGFSMINSRQAYEATAPGGQHPATYARTV